MDKFRIDAAIVGAPKCGSTSLYDYFSTQDHIVAVAEAKDFPVFSRPEDLAERLQRLREFGYVERSDKPQVIGDVNICFERSYLESLKSTSAQVKVIMLVREPLRRIQSSYLFNVERLIETRSLATALNEEADGILPDWGSKDWRQKAYLKHSAYEQMISDCRDVFGDDHVIVVDFEDLVHSFEATRLRLEDFLGIPLDSEIALPKANVTSGQMRWRFLAKTLFQGERSSILWSVLRKVLSQKTRSRLRISARKALRKSGAKKPEDIFSPADLSDPAREQLAALQAQYENIKSQYGNFGVAGRTAAPLEARQSS